MDDKKLTLEAGKYYRTRDGRKAYVAGISPFQLTNVERKAVGFIDGEDGEETWATNGKWRIEDTRGVDLVAEWFEPKRIKGWQNFYINPHGVPVTDCFFNSTKAGADEMAKTSASTRIACIEVDVLEGAGLNGEGA